MTEEIKNEQEIVSEAPKGQDAPKAGAAKAEPMQKVGDFEDLGPAVVKPTDKNPDAAKKTKKDASAPTKGAGAPESAEKMKKEEAEPEDAEDKENDKKDDEEEKAEDYGKMETPKTKSGMIQAMYDNMNKMKKADLQANYGKMMKAMNMKMDMDPEDKEDEDKEKEMAAASEAVEKRVKEINVEEDVNALVSGDETLSEDFKAKAATIFEAAVKSKVRNEIERLEGEYSTEITEATNNIKEELTNKVDNYLNYVVEEWMKENELAIEKGIKGEIAEDFIGGLKQLFEDHYIDVPDEKYDVLGAKETELEEAKSKINDMTEKMIEKSKVINEFTKEEILEDITSGLADTEVEKLKSLVEDISYEGADEYRTKLETIKESYFGQGASKAAPASTENVDTLNTDNGNTVTDMSDSMSRYTAAISRVKGRDIYNN